ncbi:MAG: ABC transporter ATP-binding protein [Rhodospirillaceae bacterium]|nr:ABC transporter ATP-binding protein [Rhodospirillaceae bacterium]MCY4311140.1 ABC transporter ATP-binding protein [Rhodospirillaceae bacterium]
MLSLSGVETYYGQSKVLFGMDLSVKDGEVVTLMGRNGMGKTTTIRSIMGLTPARAGAITFDGEDIRDWPPYRVARTGLGLVPEGRQVFPNLTVEENLIATHEHRHGSTDPWTLQKIYDLFPGVAARRRNMGNQLSGGEQQMVAVSRALMTNPKLLILDEATEGLAPLIRQDIWNTLDTLKAHGESILVVDKNVDALTRLADRHYIIEKGQVVWTGDSDALRADEELQHRYLGI